VGSLVVALGVYDLSRWQARRLEEEASLQAEATRLRAGFSGAGELLAIKDPNGVYLAANPAYAAMLGKKPQTVVGGSDVDFLPHSQASAFGQVEQRVLQEGQEQSGIEILEGSDGKRTVEMRRMPLRSTSGETWGLLVAAQDVTEWKGQLELAREQVQGSRDLHQAVQLLLEAPDEPALYQAMLSGATRLTGTKHTCLWLAAGDPATLQLRAASGKLANLDGLRLRPGEDLPSQAWQSGQAAVAMDYGAWNGRPQALQNAGFASAAALPLKINAQVAGVIGLYYEQALQDLHSTDLERLELFAIAASTCLQNTRRGAGRQAELEERGRVVTRQQYRLRLEHVVAAMATRFILLPAAKTDEALERALQTLVKFAVLERAYLVLFPADGLALPPGPEIYMSDEQDNHLRLADQQADDFQWILGRLNQLETVHIAHLPDLPADLEEAAAYLQRRNLRAFTAIPLVLNRSLIGYLALESAAIEPEWSPEILALFKISAEMFVSLLERKWSANAQDEQRNKQERHIASLEQRSRQSMLIAEMGDLLQACRTADEAYPIITRYVTRLLPDSSGALYLVRHADDPAENVMVWGDSPPGAGERELGANECWGLRRGRLHSVLDMDAGPLCAHVREPQPASYVCAPLVAQGAAVGILHLRQDAAQATAQPMDEERQQLVTRIAEYIALALANLSLRDTLRSQAIRDPLTGLFNRRYMEETLDREIRRAGRHTTTVGVIMFDIDRMKPINDTYGHDAGDMLLRALGEQMQRFFRGEDVACRYGGDEFTIVLPEASLADVWRRAEQLRDAVKKLDLRYDGRSLGPITLSIGVAAYPDHGLTVERLLLAADAASYASKSEGGDRIMVGRDVEG
jgi:diguanylate cyclase (GGDEF)-like protein/PAS domain S-box-containing protein